MTPLKFGLIVLCALCAVQLTNAFEETTSTNRWCTFSYGWLIVGATPCKTNSQTKADAHECCSWCVQTDACRGFMYDTSQNRCYCAASWTGWSQVAHIDSGTMPAP